MDPIYAQRVTLHPVNIKAIFENKLKHFGQLQSDLEKLAKANRDISEACSVTAADNSALRGDSAWWGPGLVGYKVTGGVDNECKLMVMAEISFVDRISKRQNRGVGK